MKNLGQICLVAGFVSIAVSITVWFLGNSTEPGHSERLGIFVGLWAPTFFALSNKFDKS